MPDTHPVLRDAPAPAAPHGDRPAADSTARRVSGRGAEIVVRVLWLALGFALGVSAGLMWAGSVMAGG